MKPRYILAALTLAGLLAHATPVDPVFSMDDPSLGSSVGLGFTFSANPSGGGVLSFTNDSGVEYTRLDFFVTLSVNDTITCLPQPFFNTCQFTFTSVGNGNGLFDIGVFNVPSSAGGIAPGQSFVVDLNNLVDGALNPDPNGVGGWGPGNTFTAVVNDAPEPASWLLLTAGFAALLGSRLFRRRRQTAP